MRLRLALDKPVGCSFVSVIFMVLFFILIILMAAVICGSGGSGGEILGGAYSAQPHAHTNAAEKIKKTCVDSIDGVCRFPMMIRNWKDSDYDLFEISPGPVSVYSSLMPWHIKDVNAVLAKEIKTPPSSIIDLTSHIGADSVNFLKLYPKAKITSVEIDQNIGGILKRNMTTFMEKLNIPPEQSRVVIDDARNIIKGERYLADVVFIDPPWLGSRDIPKLGDEPLEKYIQLMRGRAKVVFVKLPRESEYEAFAKSIGMPYTIYPIHDGRWGKKVSYWMIAFAAQ